MRFGKIPLSQAEGAILAHSTTTNDGKLKKGQKLTKLDLETLQSSGINDVIAASLDAHDIEEDKAAARLASAIAGQGVRIGDAFTGRVNLFAEFDGLLCVERLNIDQFNSTSETITLATLNELEHVHAGQMIATIKIIPFAAPTGAIDACLERVGEWLVSIAPFRPLLVRLIQTELPAIQTKVLDKTSRITQERVKSIGSELISENRCPHETTALAKTINELDAHDVLLIAGASAITDRRDVLPAAIEQADGHVLHFGMPVDPGNLLLLAERHGKPVFGMPGCARSPKLNGFDWVLQRTAAGIEITPQSIMKMGVGGLLSEISTRPQPRLAKKRAPAPRKIAALILAAGQSRRMGNQNKLLIDFDGKSMLRHVVDEAERSAVDEIIVVTGHQSQQIESELAGKKLRLIHNNRYQEGLSTSLKKGLEALDETIDGVLICLGDMPLVTSELFDQLIRTFDPKEGRTIIVPTRHGKRGNPVLWSSEFFKEMQELEGDVGARHLIGLHDDKVNEVELPDDSTLTDFDTPESLGNWPRKSS